MGSRTRGVAMAAGAAWLLVPACRTDGSKLTHGFRGDASTEGDVAASTSDGSSLPDAQLDACGAPVTCVDGGCTPSCATRVCSSGTVCTNPDPDHCLATCSGSSDAASPCGVLPRDADRDGHGDALCAAAPGDDCADWDPLMHPGAKERCNGLDDDCDGLVDSFDDLPVGGSVFQPYTGGPGIVGLVAAGSGYVLQYSTRSTYGGSTDSRVLFLDGSGNVVHQDYFQLLTELEPALAVDGNTVTIVGAAPGPGDAPGATAQRIDVDTGNLVGTLLFLGTGDVNGAAVAPALDGGLVAAWTQGENPSAISGPALQVRRITSDGSMGPVLDLTLPGPATTPRRPSVTAGPGGYGVTWVDAVGQTTATVVGLFPRLTLLDATLAEQGQSVSLDSVTPTSGGVPMVEKAEDLRLQIVGTSDGYVIGWFDGQGRLKLQKVTASGSAVCGPVLVDGAAQWAFSGSLLPDGAGALAAYSDDGALARLVHIDGNCVLSSVKPEVGLAVPVSLGTPVPGMSARVGQPAMTRTADGHIAVAWVDAPWMLPDGGADAAVSNRYLVRVMSSRLCD